MVSANDTTTSIEGLLRLSSNMLYQIPATEKVTQLELEDRLLVIRPRPRPTSCSPQSIYMFQIGEDECLDRMKSSKLAQIAPHKLNSPSAYASLQNSEEERILDDCLTQKVTVPPLALLYSGLSHFTDSTSGAAIKSCTFFNPEIPNFKDDINEFLDAICKVDREQGDQDRAKWRLSLFSWFVVIV